MVVENMSSDDREKWLIDLYAPLSGASPDNVSEETIADEMRAFMALNREVG